MKGRLNKVFYEHHRHEILDGDIVGYSGEGLVSSAIKLATGSDTSHTGFLSWWNGRLMVLEAVGKGLIVTPFSKNVNEYHGRVKVYKWRIPLTKKEQTNMLEYASWELGEDYSTFGMLYYGLRPVFMWDIDERDEFKRSVRFYCSHWTAKITNKAGRDLKENLADRFMSPDDVVGSKHLDLRFGLSNETT